MKIPVCFILVLSLFMTGSLALAQEIPVKANTIVIALPDSNQVPQKIQKVFAEKGYTVKNPNKVLPPIFTDAKTLKNSRVSLSADFKGQNVFLTGNIVVVGQGNMRIEHKGTKGTPIYVAWEELDKVAKAFGGKLTYEIK